MNATQILDELIVTVLKQDLENTKAEQKSSTICTEDREYAKKLKKALKRVLHYYGE